MSWATAMTGLTPRAISADHGALFAARHPELTPLPGASGLLARYADLGLAVAVATSAQEGDLDALRRALDAEASIDEVATSETQPRANQARTSSWRLSSRRGSVRTGSCSSGRAGATSPYPPAAVPLGVTPEWEDAVAPT